MCGNRLTGGSGPDALEEICPEIPPTYESHLGIRITAFISITAIVFSFAVYLIFPTDINWPVFVVFGIASMWISLLIIVRKGRNIPKTILWQVVTVTLLSVFWDWQTGWNGWALDYVAPIIFVAAVFVMYITAKIMKLGVRDYILYAFLDGVLGIIPILFLSFRWVHVLYPSILCAACSLAFLAAVLLFHGKSMREEWDKRMHL